jgi:hypothetical protein
MKIVNKGKNVYFVLIIGIVLTGLLIFIEKKSPAEENTKANVLGWQTYQSQQYNLEIQFPEDWQIEIIPQGIKVKNSSGSRLEIIQMKNERDLSLDNWFREFTTVGGRPTVTAAAQRTTLDGKPAYKLDSGLEPPNPLFEAYIADDQRRVFELSATTANTNDSATLNTILSTFHFR